MGRQNLFKLFSNLSPLELDGLGHYLDTPLYNGLKDVRILYREMKRHVLNFERFPQDEILFKKAYPNKPFNKGRIPVLFSRFIEKFKDYLYILECRDVSKSKKHRVLADSFRRREMPKLFLKELENAEKEVRKNFHGLASEYEELREILHEKYFSQSCIFPYQYSDELISKVMTLTDEMYFVRKMMYAVELQNRRLEFRGELIEEVQKVVRQKDSKSIANIFLNLAEQPIEISEEYYSRLKHQVFLLLPHLPSSSIEANRLLFLLLHYTIDKILTFTSGRIEDEIYQLSLYGIDNKIFLPEGYIEENDFLNVILIGLKLNNNVHFFIKEYKHFLRPEIKDKVLTYCNALVQYEKKKYKDVIYIMQGLKYNHFAERVRGEIIFQKANIHCLLRNKLSNKELIYFENSLNSYELYIKRNPNKLGPTLVYTEITRVKSIKKIVLQLIQNKPFESIIKQLASSAHFIGKDTLINILQEHIEAQRK